MWAEMDGVFFGRHKTIGSAPVSQLEKLAHISRGIRVVIPIKLLGGNCNACSAQIFDEPAWTGNAAECNWMMGYARGLDRASHPPNRFVEMIGDIHIASHHDGIGPIERRQRFAQATGWQ